MPALTDKTTDDIIADGDYESCIELTRHLDESVGQNQFSIGDIAEFVYSTFGKKFFKEYARDSQLKINTAHKYRRMSAHYPKEVRQELMELNGVNYSILDVARRIKPDATLEDSKAFIRDCIDKGINTVDGFTQARKDLKTVDPDKPVKIARVEMVVTRSEDGKLTFHADNVHPDTLDKLNVGDELAIHIWTLPNNGD
jgi:hypothetical protein